MQESSKGIVKVRHVIEGYKNHMSTGLRNAMKSHLDMNISRFYALAVCDEIRDIGDTRSMELSLILRDLFVPKIPKEADEVLSRTKPQSEKVA